MPLRKKKIDTAGERSLDSLLKTYEKEIDQLRQLCQPIVNSCSPDELRFSFNFDEIFLLRCVCLSDFSNVYVTG